MLIFNLYKCAPNFSLGKGKMTMVPELPSQYHPIVPCLLKITHKHVYYAGCKKPCEYIIVYITTWNHFISSILIEYHLKKPNLVHSVSDVNKSKKDSVIKSDNDSINVHYMIQTVQVELKKVRRRSSLLKPYQSKVCYIKT